MTELAENELRDLLDEETEASEADRDQPIGGGTVDRPNRRRSVVFSVRLNPDELQAVQQLADRTDLPSSTLVRAWIVERIRAEESISDLRAAIAVLRRDLERVESFAS